MREAIILELEMSSGGFSDMPLFLVLGTLCVCFVSALIMIFHKLWWVPHRLQNLMQSQGIKGPSYRFIHGNAKQIMSLRNEAISKPLGLSHNIFPRIQPHMHCWIKLYGIIYITDNSFVTFCFCLFFSFCPQEN